MWLFGGRVGCRARSDAGDRDKAAEQSFDKLDEVARRHPEAADALTQSRQLVSGLMDDLRRLSHGLHPHALDKLSLQEALRDLAESVSTGDLTVETELDLPEATITSPEVTLIVFRVTQAALANVVAHARARRARISLSAASGVLSLAVEDFGVGFDPGRLTLHQGIGIAGMRERIAWIGGQFELKTSPGAGTHIFVRIPLIPASSKITH